MPTYIFQNPKTDELVEVVQSIHDNHIYIDESGLQWDRVFTSPLASVDSKPDVYDQNKFAEKTDGKGSLGDLWDRSKEWSEKRKNDHGGIDPLQQKSYKDYAKKRNGKRHPNDKISHIKI